MLRALLVPSAVYLLFAVSPVLGQVVESDPNPARTDQPVTLTFHADRGNGQLEDCNCDIWVHTGLITSESADNTDWRFVMDEWPENRDLTKLEQVGDNTFELEIEDIRDFYSQNRTGAGDVPPRSVEEIEQLAFVFRDADGERQTQDLFVDVNDVGGTEPIVTTSLLEPDADPPLFPFMSSQDTTVTVSVSADTARVDAFEGLRLFVDGAEVASDTTTILEHDLALDTPNRFEVQAVAEATAGNETLTDTVETFLIRTPDVVDEARPPDVQDGVNVESESRVILSMFAPEKDFVYAIGDFSEWEIDEEFFMKRHQVTPDSVHWWVEIDGLSAAQQYDYQFFVDGEIRMSDPFATKVRSPDDQFLNQDHTVFPGLEPYPEEQTENLVAVFDTAPDDFEFSAFDRPDQDELVIYELLVRDFREQHSFQALTDSLNYLDSLGVNAIELMPVNNFDGNISWGYNPNHQHAVDKSYGPAKDLKRFIEEAHRRGIAVILDVVYNHVTDRAPFVELFGTGDENPFLNVPASSPFSVFNQLNHGNPYVRQWMDRANKRWLEEFNFDGFRFDLSKGFISGQPSDPNGFQQDRIDNLQRMADAIWEVDPEAYVILEHFGVEEEERALAGHRADETGGMMLWHNMNRPYSQADMGFLEGDDFSSDLSSSYFADRWGDGTARPNYVTYMESHDEQWLMRRKKLFGNASDQHDTQTFETALNRQKLVGAFFFTVPGPRMMWQFGELGYGWGPDECLKPGGGGNGECSAGAPGRTAPKPVRWDYADPEQSPDRVRLFKTWSALINLRKAHDVFDSPDTEVETKLQDGDRIRWIRLEHPSMDALVVGNFGLTNRTASVTFPEAGTWFNVFENTSVQIDDPDQDVLMTPGEFRIFTSEEPAITPEEGLVPGGAAQPSALSVDVRQTFGPVTNSDNYRLVALPGSTRVPFADAASGTPGETWRAFLDDGSDSDFLVEFDEADDRFTLRPGNGFWMLSRGAFSFEDTVPPVSLTDGQAAIPVREGWNIISNPLSLDVSWEQVQVASGITAPLYRWQGGTFGETDTFASATSGEAFYVNVESGVDSLRLPFPGSLAAQRIAETERPPEIKSVQAASDFTIEARLDSTATSAVRLGETEGPTSVEHAAPRSPFTSVALKASGTGDTPLSTLIRKADESDQTTQFDLSLEAPSNTSVELRATGLDDLEGRSVEIVNQSTGTVQTVEEDQPVSITTTADTTPLRVRVGAETGAGTSVVPDEVRLHNNYPNPFRQSTTIEFDLPEATSVRLSVYDVLGRRVETILNERRPAGRHEVRWNGQQQSLSSGVYFLRLEAGDVVETGRMTLIR